MSNKKAIIALNGELKGDREQYLSLLDRDSFLIAADAGVLLFEELGLRADLILGDLDSLPAARREYYQNKGIKIMKYPVEKDETDGELALEYCKRNNLNDIEIIGSLGGRFDHQIANILLLEYGYQQQLSVKIIEPGMEMGLITGFKVFKDCQGEILSLIPLDNKVNEVSIKGCKYNLEKEDLYRFKSRGISNQISKNRAEISLEKGLLLYIKLSKYTK